MRRSHLVEAPVADTASAREPPSTEVDGTEKCKYRREEETGESRVGGYEIDGRTRRHVWRGDEWCVGGVMREAMTVKARRYDGLFEGPC